jgi:hypothetical protein
VVSYGTFRSCPKEGRKEERKKERKKERKNGGREGRKETRINISLLELPYSVNTHHMCLTPDNLDVGRG